MRELTSLIDTKRLKKLFRNGDFIFSILCYPVVVMIYIFLRFYVSNSEIENIATWYTVSSFLILTFIAILSLIERIDTFAFYKGQGDKLKLKRQEGNWKS